MWCIAKEWFIFQWVHPDVAAVVMEYLKRTTDYNSHYSPGCIVLQLIQTALQYN